MNDNKPKSKASFKGRYVLGIIGIAVGIFGIVTSLNKQKKRKRTEKTIQEWSDQQRKQADTVPRLPPDYNFK